MKDREALLMMASVFLCVVRKGTDGDVSTATRCINFRNIAAHTALADKFGKEAALMANDIRTINQEIGAIAKGVELPKEIQRFDGFEKLPKDLPEAFEVAIGNEKIENADDDFNKRLDEHRRSIVGKGYVAEAWNDFERSEMVARFTKDRGQTDGQQ